MCVFSDCAKPTPPEISDADEVVENFALVTDVADVLYERMVNCASISLGVQCSTDSQNVYLDDSDGKRSAAQSAVIVDRTRQRYGQSRDTEPTFVAARVWSTPLTRNGPRSGAALAPGMKSMFARDEAPRPQLQFADTIDNTTRAWYLRAARSRASAFVDTHRRRLHPAAVLEARQTIVRLRDELVARERSVALGAAPPPPSDVDLLAMHVRLSSPPTPAAPLDETPVSRSSIEPTMSGPGALTPRSTRQFEFVDTLPQLQRAAALLSTARVIGVDVEHHSFRSFLGFTCLIQVRRRLRVVGLTPPPVASSRRAATTLSSTRSHCARTSARRWRPSLPTPTASKCCTGPPLRLQRARPSHRWRASLFARL